MCAEGMPLGNCLAQRQLVPGRRVLVVLVVCKAALLDPDVLGRSDPVVHWHLPLLAAVILRPVVVAWVETA